MQSRRFRPQPTNALTLYLAHSHPCAYLPERIATNAVLDPTIAINRGLYGALLDRGFRRSGLHLYRPHCLGCTACVATRIPVEEFTPSRSQRRCANRNSDLSIAWEPVAYSDEAYALFSRYLAARHPQGGMDGASAEDFVAFLDSTWSDTWFMTVRAEDGRLLALAVTDCVDRGLSAVYTFFEPDARSRGLGVFAILTQIGEARRFGLDYVYLGYWIGECDKMAYKVEYQPIEGYVDGRWQRLDRSGAVSEPAPAAMSPRDDFGA